MSEFLQRNKKKGLLAFLLLFLQRGKGAGPLVLMVALLAILFVLPTGLLGKIPFLGAFAQRLGLAGGRGGGGEGGTVGLSEALDAARSGPGYPQLAAVLGALPGAGGFGRSTMDYVKGKGVLDQDAAGAGAEKDGAGKAVDGVPTPEDAEKMGDGVAMDSEELQNGLMNSAFAGVGRGGLGGGSGAEMAGFSGGGGGGGGGGVGSGARLDRGRADDRGAGLVASALDGSRVPVVGNAAARGGAGGKMGWRKFRSLGARTSNALSAPGRSGRGTVMYQLAEGRAYSVAAAPPPGLCAPGMCPSEFASNTSGAVFDGSRPGAAGIISAPAFDGAGGAGGTPSMGQINTLTEQATQMEDDARKCEEAERVYGPQERAKMAEIQADSDRLNSMNCNSGGCSKSKYNRCKAVGDQMRVKCREYNRIAQQKAAACPLMNGQYSPMDCSQ